MADSFDLPFSNKSPERLMEEREEKRPRRHAQEIFKRYAAHERAAAVERKVPRHMRAMVLEHLAEFARRERELRGSA